MNGVVRAVVVVAVGVHGVAVIVVVTVGVGRTEAWSARSGSNGGTGGIGPDGDVESGVDRRDGERWWLRWRWWWLPRERTRKYPRRRRSGGEGNRRGIRRGDHEWSRGRGVEEEDEVDGADRGGRMRIGAPEATARRRERKGSRRATQAAPPIAGGRGGGARGAGP